MIQLGLLWAASLGMVVFSHGADLPWIYNWYDGNQKKDLQMSAELIAEFDASPSTEDLFNEPVGVQVQARPTRSVRIWRLSKKYTLKSALQKLNESHRTLSPVFTDGKEGGGATRALPGGVILSLPLKWSEEEMRRWAEKRHLKVVKALSGHPHTLLIQTAPGLESLLLANRLYFSGEVISASPNWWREVSPR